ncbi:Uncharacterised protein [Bordetella pertussis]|nr:Uncharacterised protein [Bordetella pertussis]
MPRPVGLTHRRTPCCMPSAAPNSTMPWSWCATGWMRWRRISSARAFTSARRRCTTWGRAIA